MGNKSNKYETNKKGEECDDSISFGMKQPRCEKDQPESSNVNDEDCKCKNVDCLEKFNC